jgi:hypothetical protein
LCFNGYDELKLPVFSINELINKIPKNYLFICTNINDENSGFLINNINNINNNNYIKFKTYRGRIWINKINNNHHKMIIKEFDNFFTQKIDDDSNGPNRQAVVIKEDDLYISYPEHYKCNLVDEKEISEFINLLPGPFIIEYIPQLREGFDEDPEKNVFRAVLHEYLVPDENYTGDCPFGVIPYDLEERFRMYPKAFRELRRFMPSEILEKYDNFIQL